MFLPKMENGGHISSTSSSDSSSQNAPPRRPPLPILSLRQKIVEKIQENRVTLIVGDTGCGKSSQVPLFLLEENMEPIVCTQPRRFAVVTIARMVAELRNCQVGGEVGYHIGHSNVTTERSKLVFKTAGVLLEQMRDRGLAALDYKVIILDEVHERSVESDLVLACVKQFMMRSNDLKVVLMSATADTARYKNYFKDLGRGERVEVIAIPSLPQNILFQREVMYLEQVVDLLELETESSESLSSIYCNGPNRYADAEMKPVVHSLIHKLILHIHENEPDMTKSILVFLPTYYALEKQWVLLEPLSTIFKVNILHSSIDTDQALLAMKIWKSHRKVILATNIAESSVTIPGVAFVIDSCRSLQVLWDQQSKSDTAKLVWVSKSQAEQRKGRTGRTCDGHIYRFVTRQFYNSFNDYEHPAILRLSLRHQVLMICCAESKAINDPRGLLQKVLDPPDSEAIEEALDLLVHIHAVEPPLSTRGRFEPTYYGRLLDSLPLSFDASVLALKFGEMGLLREGIIVSILMDIQPLPVLQPFGNPILASKYVDNYFEVDASNHLQSVKKEAVFIANLCAYKFWQHVFKDKQRLERLKEITNFNELKESDTLIAKFEEEWCSVHNVLQTSLQNVSELYEDVISNMHRFRPAFLAAKIPTNYELSKFSGTQREAHDFIHRCVLRSELVGGMNSLKLENENGGLVMEGKDECLAVPYATCANLNANFVLENFQLIVKEVKALYMEEAGSYQEADSYSIAPEFTSQALCRYFMIGSCTRGDFCPFSHSIQAARPICKFYGTLKGCRNGASCFFSHDISPNMRPIAKPHYICPQGYEADSPRSFLRLLSSTNSNCIIILNDKDLRFTSSISHYYDPTKIIATTPNPYSSELAASTNDAKIFWNTNNPCNLIINPKVNIIWKDVHAVLLFIESDEKDPGSLQSLVEKFFEALAIRVFAQLLNDLKVIVTVNNIRYAQLQVEKLARECFFSLTESIPYDQSTFGKVIDPISSARPLQVCAPFSYVFNMDMSAGMQLEERHWFADYLFSQDVKQEKN